MPKLNVLVAGSTGYIGVQLVKLLSKHKKVNIKYCSPREDDPRFRKPHLLLAKNKLDWQPTINLDEGISRTILYFRKILDL